MPIRPPIPLHTHRAYVGEQYDRALPDILVDICSCHLLAGDSIGGPEYLKSLVRNRADDSNRETRTRERLSRYYRFRQAEFAPNASNLILEERTKWFNKSECHVLRQAADVMMTLDILSA